MKYTGLARKISAAAMAVLLSAGALSGGSMYSITADYEDEISSLEQRQAELAEERRKLEDTLKEYTDNVDEQDEYLKLYDEKMSVQEQEMANINEQINIINDRLDELDKQIADKQKEVDAGVEAFRERLRAMYIAGNDTVAEVLAGSSNFYDMLARLEMVQRVSQHDNEMIKELTDKIESLNSDKEALENERTALDDKKTEQLAVLDELRETYANHQQTKEWYENQAAAQQERTDEVIAKEQQAEEELQDYIRKQQEEIAARMAEKKKKQEEERKKKEAEKKAEEERLAKEKEAEEAAKAATETEKPAETTAAVTEAEKEEDYDTILPDESDDSDEFTVTARTEDHSGDFADPYSSYEFGKVYSSSVEEESSDSDSDSSSEDKGYGTSSDTGFIWPVPTVRNITDTYGSRYIEEEGSTSFHKGIDINKPNCSGEAIVASAGGVVITASDTGNGYGTHVVIDHGDGIATLYGHMSSAAVSVGDEVQQGQVIGYIGNSGYAYGYHCHFEVRVNGQHTDPFNYVSMDN